MVKKVIPVYYHNAERLAIDLKTNSTRSFENFEFGKLFNESQTIGFIFNTLLNIQLTGDYFETFSYYVPCKRMLYAVYDTIEFWTTLDTK